MVSTQQILVIREQQFPTNKITRPGSSNHAVESAKERDHSVWKMKTLLGQLAEGRIIKIVPECVLSCFSCVWLFATLRTVACQAPLSVGFSRQEYWTGLPFRPPGDLSNSRIKPVSFMSPALTDMFFTTSTTWEAQRLYLSIWNVKHTNFL